MYWLPVIFLCMGPNECGFVVGDTKQGQPECEKSAQEMVYKIATTASPPVLKGACVPVKFPTI